MTLHEAIIKLLVETGRQMTTQEIADELNHNGWYQKRDGSKISAFQIHGRTRNYPQFFDRDGSIVSLASNSKEARVQKSKSKSPVKEKQSSVILSVNLSELEERLMNKKHFQSVGEIDHSVPHNPGLYSLRVRSINKLPAPFDKHLAERGHNIIYIGIASKSLNRRMLNQELRANGHGTFFRSTGAMLGYRPPKGSLIHRKNKRNYKFSTADEQKIIEWMNSNLLVNWIEVSRGLSSIETKLVSKYQPLLNIAKNPAALPILSQLRKECVDIANSR
jgi:hypothetical protein